MHGHENREQIHKPPRFGPSPTGDNKIKTNLLTGSAAIALWVNGQEIVQSLQKKTCKHQQLEQHAVGVRTSAWVTSLRFVYYR